MKKRLLMMAIMIVAVIGFAGIDVCAAEEKLTTGEINSARNVDMGKNYTVTWKDGVTNVNKISLAKKGLLTITASKVSNPTLGMRAMNVAVYDANGKIAWECRDEGGNTNPSFYVGLNAGTYYVVVETSYVSYVEGTTTTYSFEFTANQYVEAENNNTKETATPIQTDVTYTGYLGSGFSVTDSYDDGYDVYKVKLVKGKKYRLVVTGVKGTTLCNWGTKSTAVDDIFNTNDEGKDYVASYTGDHYICVWNYGNEQYKYTIQMRTVSNYPPKTSITSLSGGKKSFVVKWKKVKCSGYQIQYADNKKMEKAVTKTIKKSGTVKYQVKKLKAKKKYYVRVRAYKTVKGKKYWSDWSKIKSVKTKK
ncbi:MAG: fibronectin type III domain-containing protein [Lachnospiraceae bacterium]|nr:fibronectin type III domain-containing protein [Lachnospiraceae bacterium]